MTRQEIFDKVYLGLKSQGFRQSINNYQCVYRGPYGRRCAIGHLMPAEVVLAEGRAWECGSNGRTVQKVVGAGNGQLLTTLQQTHDAAASFDPNVLEDKLRGVAAFYGLTIPGDL